MLCHSKMKFTDCFHPLHCSRDHSLLILELDWGSNVPCRGGQTTGPLAQWRATTPEASGPKARNCGLFPPLYSILFLHETPKMHASAEGVAGSVFTNSFIRDIVKVRKSGLLTDELASSQETLQTNYKYNVSSYYSSAWYIDTSTMFVSRLSILIVL